MTLLTGCASISPTSDFTVKWQSGKLYNGNKEIPATKYTGTEAIVENGKGGLTYELSLDSAKDVTNITLNVQNILEEQMSSYKDAKYYTEYLGSSFTMAKNIAPETFAVCHVNTKGMPAETVAAFAYEYISSIPLTSGKISVDFGDFIFGDDYDTVEVRGDAAVITGVAKVSPGTHETKSTYIVVQGKKEYQLQKGSSSKYDYYVYNGYVIQLASGLTPESYITFK